MSKAIKPFDEILRSINHGQLVNDLTDELTDVLAMVKQTGKTGSVTLQLKLKPRGAGNEQIEIIPSVKGSKPEVSRPIAIFFINDDHGLQKNDPSQADLDGLRPVERKSKEKTA